MKKYLLLATLGLFISCEKSKKTTIEPTKKETLAKKDSISQYPQNLQKVFKAHGGLKKWGDMNTLSFSIKEGTLKEKHTSDLKQRKHLVSAKQFSIGADGKNVWLDDPKDTYKGNARFYHNLYFYFYSMPFILADPGIIYAQTEPLEFDGKQYPGIAISFKNEVGDSPDDQYFLHYDPKTNQMQWLGYTVTYGKNTKSKQVNWIRYNDWQTINGLQLPRSISWYGSEGKVINQLRSTVNFDSVQILEKKLPATIFSMPKGAEKK